jgi:hypothetical protein
MQVCVGHLLASNFAIRKEKVDAVARQRLPLSGRNALPESGHIPHFVWRDA